MPDLSAKSLLQVYRDLSTNDELFEAHYEMNTLGHKTGEHQKVFDVMRQPRLIERQALPDFMELTSQDKKLASQLLLTTSRV